MAYSERAKKALKKYWQDGLSVAEIIEKMRENVGIDMNANALHGLCWRLKLPKRGRANVIEARIKRTGLKVKDAPENNNININYGAAAILDLEVGKCKWPIGDLYSKDFHFCGASAVKNHIGDTLPYCFYHYQKSKAKGAK